MNTHYRYHLLITLLLLLTDGSRVYAQESSRPADGWQGPRPAPQAPIPNPAPQSPPAIPVPQQLGPTGKQVLEIPSRPQPPIPVPSQQQASLPPQPQPASVRPSQLLTVTVTDREGRYIPDLRPEDFIVYEEDLPQTVTYFNTGQDEPVSLGLLVDMSASMQNKLGRARQALHRLADTIQPQDEIFLEAFNQQPFVLQDFTDSRALVLQATAKLQPAGDTALYDAVLDGLRRIKQGHRQKKALVVMTDGLDTASHASLAELTAAIHGAGVLVYTIGIGNPAGGLRPLGPGAGMSPFLGAPGRVVVDEAVDSRMLSALSEETGAKHFLLNTGDVVGSGAILEAAAQTIATELRRQYSLGYRSPLKGNLYRDVRVEARRTGVVVRTQKGVD